ncbi:acyltransferase family protein [Lentibacillus sediminis]|uniref:acyltransferase family protein n=1 Tax=Lentibacillus sediminis TaxID=1940529 RepID=UPI000C1C050D|nr:acyltransferase family protein [Lentibacillus sediminis]
MKRNAFIDNAKVILIFLVVFGHMIQPFTSGSEGMNTLYLWIYTFHMPAFILLAGLFAKGRGDKPYVLNLVKKLLIPYFIFQLIFTGYYYLLGHEDWLAGIFYPQWALWFLFSLFFWHMLLYWFKKIPAAIGIFIAVQIGLIAGYFGDIGHTFSLSRTLVFFPFFLIGYWVTEEHLLLVKKRTVKIASLVVMAGLALAIFLAPEFNSGWLLGSKSYSALGLAEFGGLARLAVYLTAAAMIVSVLAWVPQRETWFTDLGAKTLYVYLLHGFFIQYFRQVEAFEVNNLIDVLGLGAISAVIVLLLSSKPMIALWQPVMEGKATKLKKGFKSGNNRKSASTQS